jgi:hypothetical protein
MSSVRDTIQQAEKIAVDLTKEAANSLSQKAKQNIQHASHIAQDATSDLEKKAKNATNLVKQTAKQLDLPTIVHRVTDPPQSPLINYVHVFGVAPALAWLCYKPEYVRYTPIVAGAIAATHGIIAYKKKKDNKLLLRSKL